MGQSTGATRPTHIYDRGKKQFLPTDIVELAISRFERLFPSEGKQRYVEVVSVGWTTEIIEILAVDLTDEEIQNLSAAVRDSVWNVVSSHLEEHMAKRQEVAEAERVMELHTMLGYGYDDVVMKAIELGHNAGETAQQMLDAISPEN